MTADQLPGEGEPRLGPVTLPAGQRLFTFAPEPILLAGLDGSTALGGRRPGRTQTTSPPHDLDARLICQRLRGKQNLRRMSQLTVGE
jgi:hypothetical protein